MKIKQGDILKKSVAINGNSAAYIASHLNISRGQLYLLFKKDIIPDKYIKGLEALGLNFKKEMSEQANSQGFDDSEKQRMQMEIDSLKELVESLKETIQAKNESIESKNIIIETQKRQLKRANQ